jgi:hypothetical protein
LGCNGRTQTVSEPSDEPSLEECPSSDEGVEVRAKDLCSILQNHVVANGFKPFTEGKLSIGAMERLLRIDGRTFEQVKFIIEWCQKDEFWLVNIRSPQKLRDKFDTLLGQSLKGKRVATFLSSEPGDSPLRDSWQSSATPRKELAAPARQSSEELQAELDADPVAIAARQRSAVA